MRMIGLTAASALVLAGCAMNDGGQVARGGGMPIAPGEAVAMLRTASGADAGRATAVQTAEGLRITIRANGLPPGTHGAHVHAVGRCDPPDFASAGGHWNPTGAQHGTMNPAGPHLGDLPNLIVGTDGRGTVAITLPQATTAGLLDADGAALVIHAGPDDLRTDPSGNSGGRIACGVFAGA